MVLMPKKKSRLGGIKKTQEYKDASKIGKWVARFRKQHKILFALAVILILYFGIKQVQIYFERKDFQTAERVVSELVSEIQAELGSAEVEEYRQCSYGTKKFEKKNLGCNFGYSLSYTVKNEKKAREKAIIADGIIKKNNEINISYEEEIIFSKPKDTIGAEYQGSSKTIAFKRASEVICSFGHTFSINHNKLTKKYIASFSCRSPNGTITNYYPMID